MKNTFIGFTLLLIALLSAGCVSQQSQTNPLIGSNAPDFTLNNALGGKVSLSDYQGRPVLLYFHMAVG